MPKNKKKFIDKKNAVTFHLVHRSQRDPLVTDEKAPQRVLKQVDSKPSKGADKEERLKYGIYFDDDYDYMQHLKPIGAVGEMVWTGTPIQRKRGVKKIELPSSVFESHVEEEVGVLNKAAIKKGLQPNLDPEVMETLAAMDEDFDFSDPENELEDNFMELANMDQEEESGDEVDEDYESDGSGVMGSGSEEEADEVASLEAAETKSRFTEYSMTSSVIRRNKHLSLLDDKFEEMFAEYDNDEIGALETEDIEGVLDPQSELLLKYADEFEKERAPVPLKTEHVEGTFVEDGDSSDSEGSVVLVKEKPQWDCQSILSTYSNLYNHPKIISAPPPTRIRVNPKTGIPETRMKLTAKALSSLGGPEPEGRRATGPGSLVSAVSQLSIRPKDEDPEQRRVRKQAFKQHKRDRRIERKLNSEAFKEEQKRMSKMMANNKSKFMIPI